MIRRYCYFSILILWVSCALMLLALLIYQFSQFYFVSKEKSELEFELGGMREKLVKQLTAIERIGVVQPEINRPSPKTSKYQVMLFLKDTFSDNQANKTTVNWQSKKVGSNHQLLHIYTELNNEVLLPVLSNVLSVIPWVVIKELKIDKTKNESILTLRLVTNLKE